MDVITDASSIINLSNAGALGVVTLLPGIRICVSPLVVGECEPTCAAELLAHKECSTVHFVDPNDISSERFLELLEAHELGEGETECLVLLLGGNFTFCCDDNKARQVGIALTAQEKVVGSLRLLKWAVSSHLCTAEDAFEYYQRMKSAGGFLPDVTVDWFRG